VCRGQIGYTVTGGPSGNLAAAADGSVDTAYTAKSAPAAGDALVATAAVPVGRPQPRCRIMTTLHVPAV
jgi:hypothetical protein